MPTVNLFSGRNHCKGAWFFYPMVVIIALLFFVSVQNSDVMGQTKWIKHLKNPVLDEKSGPLNEWNVSYHDVMFDGNTFKMWFSGWSNDHLRIGYATSPDGINWTKHPSTVLDIGAPGEWDSENVYCPSVFFDGTTYKMWYVAWGSLPGRVGLATSPDGINWTKHPTNPVIGFGPAGSWDAGTFELGTVIFDGNIYKMWYEGGNEQGNNIGYATSPDGISWTKHPSNPVLKIGLPGSFDDTAIQLPCVIFDGATYQIWYGAWDGSKDHIGYATSSDGINWTKHLNNPVLDGGNAESWENAGVTNPRVIFDGKKYRMWYMGEEIKGANYYFQRIGYANSPPPHDFRFASLLTSLERLPILANIEPTTEVLNGGLNDELNVSVSCQVDSLGVMVYSNIQTIDALTSLAIRSVAFDNWRTYATSNVMLSFCAHLTNDDDLTNDTLKTNVEISNLMDGFEFGMAKWLSDNKWVVAQGSPHTGKFSLRNSTGSLYENNLDSWAEYKHSFNLSGLNAAHISYWVRYFIETDRDFGYVEASGDNGQTWQRLGDPYTGNQATWKEEARSLTAFCSPGFADVRIRFRFVSDSTTTRPGLFIDDINIYPYEAQTAVATEESKQLPNEFVLYDNYPNPFNAQTVIEYQLPQATHLKLVVYNLLGQEIKTLINKNQEAGRFNLLWDGKDNLGQSVPSGVYFYRIQAEGFTETKKMLLLQ